MSAPQQTFEIQVVLEGDEQVAVFGDGDTGWNYEVLGNALHLWHHDGRSHLFARGEWRAAHRIKVLKDGTP